MFMSPYNVAYFVILLIFFNSINIFTINGNVIVNNQLLDELSLHFYINNINHEYLLKNNNIIYSLYDIIIFDI